VKLFMGGAKPQAESKPSVLPHAMFGLIKPSYLVVAWVRFFCDSLLQNRWKTGTNLQSLEISVIFCNNKQGRLKRFA
jgi:hypothetical protein